MECRIFFTATAWNLLSLWNCVEVIYEKGNTPGSSIGHVVLK